jgi:hypothetical protein
MTDDKEKTKDTSLDTGYGTVKPMNKAESIIASSEDVSKKQKELKK